MVYQMMGNKSIFVQLIFSCLIFEQWEWLTTRIWGQLTALAKSSSVWVDPSLMRCLFFSRWMKEIAESDSQKTLRFVVVIIIMGVIVCIFPGEILFGFWSWMEMNIFRFPPIGMKCSELNQYVGRNIRYRVFLSKSHRHDGMDGMMVFLVVTSWSRRHRRLRHSCSCNGLAAASCSALLLHGFVGR